MKKNICQCAGIVFHHGTLNTVRRVNSWRIGERPLTITAFDLDYLAFRAIFGMGLPVYMLMEDGRLAYDLLSMINQDGCRLAAIWDEDWQQVRENSDKSRLEWYRSMGYDVMPVPVDLAAIPRGIIIVAAQERYQRKWIDYCKGFGHLVYDGYDVRYYETYCKCIREKRDADSFLESCRGCRASFRSCPVRRDYYKNYKKEDKTKVIRHIAMKAGYVCNLKCNYCCEYAPRFAEGQKKPFDLEGCMADIEKLSEAMEYIDMLSFSGGDVMLNRELCVLLDEACKKENIGDIYILTNGTYLPHQDILDALERNRGRIRIVINNYSLNHEAERIVPELKKRSVTYTIRKNAGWYDLTDMRFRDRSAVELRALYKNCSFDRTGGLYHILLEGKISMRCGVANALLYYLDKWADCTSDYIDIRKMEASDIPAAVTALENRDYMDICNWCVGCKTSARTLEAAAEQLE